LDELGHFRFLRIFNLDRYVKAFRVEVEVLVDANGIWDDYRFGLSEEASDDFG
jgi:hypothetical protein